MANLEISTLDSPQNEQLIAQHLTASEFSIQKPERIYERLSKSSSEHNPGDLEAGGHRASMSDLASDVSDSPF
jgi:hypothetical protein